jgi:hypothetical protein
VSFETDGKFEVELWYDTKTLYPTKRIFKTHAIGFEGVTVETYAKCVLDADIPDEKFKIPEEKK